LFIGKSGRSLGMMPFAGKPGELRPLAFAQAPDHVFHSFKSPGDLHRYLEEDFPQMEVMRRLPSESASAWCTGPGSAFPHARWCNRASVWIGDTGIALLGDALHSFPPDLGQGVNAGLTDVMRLLALWPDGETLKSSSLVRNCLDSFSDSQAAEAEAICRLLPIGFPYQYNLPNSLAKLVFYGDFMLRMLCWKGLPWLFSPPVVVQVTQAPPAKYTDILHRHRKNTQWLCLISAAILGSSAIVAMVLRNPSFSLRSRI